MDDGDNGDSGDEGDGENEDEGQAAHRPPQPSSLPHDSEVHLRIHATEPASFSLPSAPDPGPKAVFLSLAPLSAAKGVQPNRNPHAQTMCKQKPTPQEIFIPPHDIKIRVMQGMCPYPADRCVPRTPLTLLLSSPSPPNSKGSNGAYAPLHRGQETSPQSPTKHATVSPARPLIAPEHKPSFVCSTHLPRPQSQL